MRFFSDVDWLSKNNIWRRLKVKNEHKIDIPMTDAELAAIWNQHEYCPECKGTHIKNVSKRAKVSIFGFM